MLQKETSDIEIKAKPRVCNQFLFGVSAGFAAMATGAWLVWPSSSIEYLQHGKHLVDSETATMVALMDFGNMLSPIPAGYMMNIMGRKPVLLGSALVFIVASASVLAYENKWLIYFARVMAGFGKGITFSVVPIYLAEIASTSVRGALSTMFIGFLNLGMLFGYVVGAFVNYTLLNAAVLALPLSLVATFLFFPESPYFLLMKKKNEAAKKSLMKYRRTNKNNPEQNKELEDELLEISKRVDKDMLKRGRFIDLVSNKSNLRAIFIVTVLAFLQRSSGFSPTLAYSTTIMPKKGGGAPPHVYMIIFSGLMLVTNLLVWPLVDRMGRRPLLLLSAISTAMTTAANGVYYQFHPSAITDTTKLSFVPYATLLIFAVTYSGGIGFLPSTLVGELLPTNVKSHGGAVYAITVALVSCVINKVFKEVSLVHGTHIMYYYFAFSCTLCGTFVQFFVFETKGKTFGEIQDILAGRRLIESAAKPVPPVHIEPNVPEEETKGPRPLLQPANEFDT